MDDRLSHQHLVQSIVFPPIYVTKSSICRAVSGLYSFLQSGLGFRVCLLLSLPACYHIVLILYNSLNGRQGNSSLLYLFRVSWLLFAPTPFLIMFLFLSIMPPVFRFAVKLPLKIYLTAYIQAFCKVLILLSVSITIQSSIADPDVGSSSCIPTSASMSPCLELSNFLYRSSSLASQTSNDFQLPLGDTGVTQGHFGRHLRASLASSAMGHVQRLQGNPRKDQKQVETKFGLLACISTLEPQCGAYGREWLQTFH